MTDDETRAPTQVLVPGVWKGSWIWDRTVERLRRASQTAATLTLTRPAELDAVLLQASSQPNRKDQEA